MTKLKSAFVPRHMRVSCAPEVRNEESEMKVGAWSNKITHAGSRWDSNSLSPTILASLGSARPLQSQAFNQDDFFAS